jgi:hypothetical protein
MITIFLGATEAVTIGNRTSDAPKASAPRLMNVRRFIVMALELCGDERNSRWSNYWA